jgi:hypothetical protein
MAALFQSTPSLAVPARFLLGIAAAVVATLAMDLVMARIGEGEMPPRVASGVLTETPPAHAPQRLATAVHYIAGGLTGALYIWLLLVTEALLGGPPALGDVVRTLFTAAVLYVLMVGFFVLFVLPRARGLSDVRRRAITLAWAIEAAVYVVVLASLVALAATLF